VICFDGRVLASFSLTGRRLLAALLLAGCCIVLGQAPALACTCASGHTQTHTKTANDVFTGKIAAAAPSRTDGRATTTYDVDVERVYKGDIATATVQVSSDRSAKTCGLGDLATKRRYLFFATADGAQLTTDSCSGTTRATTTAVHKVERLLGDGRPAVPPAPQKAVFTRVADTTTPSLPRLAAPGAAMVLVGLLGLVVVRRLRRRS
jgi:tissue inhibitor of metalloproteinase